MIKRLFFLVWVLQPIFMLAQDAPVAGQFSLGVRNTASLFGDAGAVGLGFGGQFRIRLAKHINTEWFADYASTNIQNLGYRKDGHIGWSVMFYPGKNPMQVNKFTPYILAGHCFDYTKVTSLEPTVGAKDKWSTATQMGLGVHYLLTNDFDVSLSSQYMIHLGGHVDSHIEEGVNGSFLDIHAHKGVDLEGHLFVTLSFNYKVAQLWSRK